MPKRLIPPFVYRLGQFTLDGSVAWFACTLAFLIRFDGSVDAPYQQLAVLLPLVAIPGRLLTQISFGLYQQVWRLFGLKDATTLFWAVSVYSFLVFGISRTFAPNLDNGLGIPLSVAVIDWSFCLFGMAALRYLRRQSAHPHRSRPDRSTLKRVLLVGAGLAGSQIVQEVRQNPQLNLKIVGFVDDDQTKIGRRVEGVLVQGTSEQMVALAQRYSVDEVLISMPSASATQIRRLVEQAQGTGLKLKVLPGQGEILRDRTLTPQARDIQIQDILGRPEIHLDLATGVDVLFGSARSQIYQRIVLVTGAGGTIGSEICRQLAPLQPKKLLLLGRGENSIFNIQQELSRDFPDLAITPIIADLRHQRRMQDIFKQWQPEIVFHAAAHKHVPLMQHNPTEAIENNALGSAYLAQLADQCGVETFVLISTDKAVDPTSFMGLSKRLAELLVKAYAARSKTRFLVVRFGNVLGSRGSVVPIFQKQIARGGPVTVTDKLMTRYFMTTPEAAQLVVQSIAVGQSGETLILDMGEPVKVYELAEQMIQLAGFTPGRDIPIKIIGLRPGEKLHESLIGSTENVTATTHPKMMLVSSQLPDTAVSERVISSLNDVIISGMDSEELWAIAQNSVHFLEASSSPQ